MSRQTLPAAFRTAFAGIGDFLRERNSRLQAGAAAVVVAAGAWLRLSPIEWGVLVLTIGGVLALETMNCAIERVVDLASPGRHELARQAKDLAAGAVLIASAAAAVVGGLIFLPRLIALWRLSG